jgi:CRP-like cAMP-binding protein
LIYVLALSPKAARRRRPFDPAAFFETSGRGRTISKHSEKEVIYSQGEAADAVFYIKKGKVEVTVVSKQGKEVVVAMLVRTNSSAKDAYPDSPSALRVR